jgi:hypothetical protein
MLNFELKYRHKKFYDILYRGDCCYIIRIFYFYFILMPCKDNSILQKKKYFKLFYDNSQKSDTHSTFIFITLNEWIFIST